MKPHHILILTLILSSIFITPIVIHRGSDDSPDISWNVIDSSLKLELSTQKKSMNLADDGSVSAILVFENELDVQDIQELENAGVNLKYRDSSIVHVGRVYSAMVSSSSDFEKLVSLGLEKATSGSKQFFPSLTTSVPATNAPQVWNNLTVDSTAITGSGSLVAIIDTGATWMHPSFWRPSTGSLNVLKDGSNYFVDVNADNIIQTTEGPIATVNNQVLPDFTYTSDYMFIDVSDDGSFEYDEGDRWLGPVDANDDGICSLDTEQVVLLGESKVFKYYDQNSGSVYIRDVNLTQATLIGDQNGHGTHVASTAAGGIPDMTSYVGMAPGADLLIIASPLDSASILDGISFATENDADVINMSFSSYLGFLDGTDPEDLAITEAFLSEGVISTLAAGNLGGRSKHASFDVSGGSDAGATISVSNPSQYSFLNVIWRSEDDDEHVILDSPGGNSIDFGQFSDISGSPFAVDEDELSAYVFPDTSIKGYNRLIVQVSTDEHEWASGTWTLSISNPSGDSVFVDAYVWDNSWSGTQLRFTSRVDNERTISSPGTADLGVTVSSYNEVTEDLSLTSSKGPRIDNAMKPEVTAPGDAINAARNSLNNLWTTRSGTSMAAPHVAGLIALLSQASDDGNQWRILSALLQGSGGIESDYDSPDFEWGWGAIDSVWSTEQLLDIDFNDIYWDGQPVLVDDGINQNLDGSLDILTIRYHRNLDSLSFSMDFRSSVDFSNSFDTFKMEVNTDNSMATGNLGIDMYLTISDGNLEIFEWSGSVFVASPRTVEWYNTSSHLIIGIDLAGETEDWEVRCTTGNGTHSEADVTDDTFVINQWSPLIDDVAINRNSDYYNITVKISDKDSTVDDYSIFVEAVDGGGVSIASESGDGIAELTLTVELDSITTDDLLCISIEVSDAVATLIYPLVPMSSTSSSNVEFVSTTLDNTLIRVGPLIDDRISGEIVLNGHLLIEEVVLSLVSESGLVLNFTLSGDDGIYDFDISPANLPLGDYELYAVARGPSGEVSTNFASLTIVADYSYVILIGGLAVIVIAVVIVALKKFRG